MIRDNFRVNLFTLGIRSTSRARKIKNEIGKRFAMSYHKMSKTSAFILLLAGLLVVPVVTGLAQVSVPPAQEKVKPKRSDTYILSAAWGSIAFWQKDKTYGRRHYLAASPPPTLQISPTPLSWDESANIAAREMKILPVRVHRVESGAPSFTGFLANLKALAEMADPSNENDGGEMNEENHSNAEEGPAVAEPIFPLENEEADSGEVSHLEEGFDTDLPAVFPRPYEQYVSGERLLMFFPIDHSSLDKWGASPLMLPVDPNISFQPPSVNLQRSSVTLRKDN